MTKSLHGRAIQSASRNDKVVVLVLQRSESQAGVSRDRCDGHAPIGPALGDGGDYGVVRARFCPVTRRTGFRQQTVNQNASPAATITVDENAVWVPQCLGDRFVY